VFPDQEAAADASACVFSDTADGPSVAAGKVFLFPHTFSACRLSKPHSRPPTVLVNELDACRPKRRFNDLKGFGITAIAADLNIRNGIPVDSGGICQISNRPI
jgi:hypothetical protein